MKTRHLSVGLSYPDMSTPTMKVIKEDDVWDSSKPYGGSFKLTMNDAIEYAISLGDKTPKYIEVNIDEL